MAFLAHWANGYLEMMPIRATAELLAVREALKTGVRQGEYALPPQAVKKIIAEASKGAAAPGDELASWLAVKHEPLLEAAFTAIVKAAARDVVNIHSKYLGSALMPWIEYGELDVKFNNATDAVRYVVEKYKIPLGKGFSLG